MEFLPPFQWQQSSSQYTNLGSKVLRNGHLLLSGLPLSDSTGDQVRRSGSTTDRLICSHIIGQDLEDWAFIVTATFNSHPSWFFCVRVGVFFVHNFYNYRQLQAKFYKSYLIPLGVGWHDYCKIKWWSAIFFLKLHPHSSFMGKSCAGLSHCGSR